MSFSSGRITAIRFNVANSSGFDQAHLDALNDHRIGRQKVAAADGVETGWAAGDSILDTQFSLEKNIINDSLQFDFRLTKDVLPPDLMRAYCQAEVKAMVDVGVQVGRARMRQCKTMARERLEEEAGDGRFAKHRLIPVLWDRPTNKVYFGNASLASIDRFTSLFEQTFQTQLEFESAGARIPMGLNQDVGPSIFVPGISQEDISWCHDFSIKDWLGNEFLHWLWYYTEVESDTFHLADETDVTIMFQKNLMLDCPRGQTGIDVFKTDGPTRLPEARRAAQSGKIPRKAFFTMVRQDTQYEFGLNAETFAIQSAHIRVEDDVTDNRARLERRVELWRELNLTLDLLYDAFLSRRCTSRWTDELRGMTAWLKREERR